MKLLAKQFQRRTTLWVSLAAAVAGGVMFGVSALLEREFLHSRSMGGAQTKWTKTLESACKYDLFHTLELTLFDWRVRQAAKVAPPIVSQLGLVVAQDSTVENLALGYPLVNEEMGLLFPRKVYGRMVRELTAQGAKAVAFDVLLSDIRKDHPGMVQPGTTNVIKSDTFFAQEVEKNGRVILASLPQQPPATQFRDAAFTLGEVDLPLDVDGSARRIRAFDDCRFLDSTLAGFVTTKLKLIAEFGTNNTVRLRNPRTGITLDFPVDTDGNVELDVGTQVWSMQAYESRRVWHMGIVLAAIELGLDLDHAEISDSLIRLHSTNDVRIERILPIEAGHMLPVDWSASMDGLNQAHRVQLMEHLLEQDVARQANPDAPHTNLWKDKLVIFGSSAKGNNLSDLGPTPLATQDFLVTTYVNVANGILQDRFIHRLPFPVELGIQLVLSLAGGVITWRLRTSLAGISVAAIALGYAGIAAVVYVQNRLWLPIVHPVVTGLMLNHAVMITWRVVFEQKERHRVRSVFAKIVSPDVVQELLKAEKVGLGGARRKLTVFFADVRGFTEMTDRYQAAAEEHVRDRQLSEAEADAYFEQQAGEVLATVNLYLATIADVVKSHGGTLDKYIGDCVMAFWGAPTPDPKHAVNCVLAAIDAQRAVQRLNEERGTENARREEENKVRATANEPLLPMLTQLALGTGINSGTMTVGLMGSDAHILNYTVFGREVNLASRLESVSGRSRIIIGQETYSDLLRYTPDLAATSVAQEPVTVKGFRQPVQVYEVPWRQS